MKLAAFLFFLAFSAQAEMLTGYVVAITDGDTIVVLDADRKQHKIRLAGIDAPEEYQAFGDRSKQNIAVLTFNKTVTVEWRKTHRERLVGKVMVGGVDTNLAQVWSGMAWWYAKYRKEQSPADQRLYQEAEQQAMAQQVGLWRAPAPVARGIGGMPPTHRQSRAAHVAMERFARGRRAAVIALRQAL